VYCASALCLFYGAVRAAKAIWELEEKDFFLLPIKTPIEILSTGALFARAAPQLKNCCKFALSVNLG
jgi:hypothetical protein